MKYNKTNQLVRISLLVALGAGLQTVEAYFNLFPAIPGGKLGFANIATVITMVLYSPCAALLVAAFRALIGSLLFNGGISFVYSVSGAVLSCFMMIMFYKLAYPKMSFIGICIIGAVAHNVAQIAVGALLMKSMFVFTYLPVLVVVSSISGAVTGLVSNIVIRFFLKNVGLALHKTDRHGRV